MYACGGVERRHEHSERGYLHIEDASGVNMIYTSDYTRSTRVMSAISVGHSGKCTNCHLCLKRNAKMKHLHQLQSQPQFRETYTWLKEHNPGLDNAACLCLPCAKQIQRNHHRVYSSVVSKAPIIYLQNYAMSKIARAQSMQKRL